MLRKKPEELLNLQEKEITPLISKLAAFTKQVREDMRQNRISKADGRKLILKATMVIKMLNNIRTFAH
ncbi:MAG TPA: hypothetical protein VMT12_01685 [Syntrophales bacterium]|nr:hypothetical protein [Syntrophales bacterium]